jgi:hypothetical protein
MDEMPKMRTTKQKVYTIDELDEAARERALDSIREGQADYDWWDTTYDQFVDEWKGVIDFNTKPVKLMSGKTRYDPEIFFSGFWSQGDGASFYGTIGVYDYLKITKQLTKYRSLAKASAGENYTWKIEEIPHGGGGCHSGYMTIDGYDWDGFENERAANQYSALVPEVKQWVRGLADDLYNRLQSEYEWLTSEESCLDSISANGYVFYESGKFAGSSWETDEDVETDEDETE